MPNFRVKVSTADLIEAIHAHRAKAAAHYDRQYAKYVQQFDRWKAKVAKADPVPQYGDRYGDKLPYAPYPPRSPDLEGYDRDIRLLEMSEDDTLVITASSDFYRYFA